MASFTPSNLSIANVGSLKLTIARVEASVTSGTNYWASGIQDIQTVLGSWREVSPDITGTNLAISFTGSTGTIHTIIPLGNSATAYEMLVFSGLAIDMTP